VGRSRKKTKEGVAGDAKNSIIFPHEGMRRPDQVEGPPVTAKLKWGVSRPKKRKKMEPESGVGDAERSSILFHGGVERPDQVNLTPSHREAKMGDTLAKEGRGRPS